MHSDSIPTSDSQHQTAVRFEYSPDFPAILQHLNASLVITTYQAGQVVVVGVEQGKLVFSFHRFDQPMGVAVGRDRIAIGTRREIQLLQSAVDIAKRIDPAGTYDSAWIFRSQWIAGATQIHEMAWTDQGLCFVNTLFSCLCTFDQQHSFVPIWAPPFISALEPQDRCHLNGLALKDGRPAYVTCHGHSDQPGGWRPDKFSGGVIVEVESGELVATNLSMPHSPRWANNRLWVLNSGAGTLCSVDEQSGLIQAVEKFPGYVRGLDFSGQFAFVGLSKIRERSVFGDLPIEKDRANLRCGVGVFDLYSGRSVASLQFHSGVEEIFAVSVVPRSLRPFIVGPSDGVAGQEIWILPESARAPGQAQPQARTTVDLEPQAVASRLATSAQELHQQGRLNESLAAFEQSLSMLPRQATTLCNLGNLWQDLENQHRAIECYQQALEIDPVFVPALQNLGYLYCAHGRPESAVEVYRKLLEIQPSPLNRLLDAGILPVIYSSSRDVEYWRDRLTQKLDDMILHQQAIDTEKSLVPTSFFLAYQGKNNAAILRKYGEIYTGPKLVSRAREPLKTRSDGRIRIGFLSAYFRDHTIGRLNLGRIKHLDRKRFEITAITTKNRSDPTEAEFRTHADRFVTVDRNVKTARDRIVDQDLDILIFADVGMDSLTSTLVWSRMAPLQGVTWGHPETTGSSQIDFYLSSKLLEAVDGQRNYTEKLVTLHRLATYFERPQQSLMAPMSRTDRRQFGAALGLPTNASLYVCPQTLYKMHPDFDPILASILSKDSMARLVLIDGRESNWTDRLKQRFDRSLGTLVERIIWLKPLARVDYLRLLAAADVVLDPIHFGGGHSSYEAFAMGAPIVTMPGDLLRNRITLALYRLMGIEQLVVSSQEQYVDVAFNIANDQALRDLYSLQIIQANSQIFENIEEVKELDEWLWSLTTADGFAQLSNRSKNH